MKVTEEVSTAIKVKPKMVYASGEKPSRGRGGHSSSSGGDISGLLCNIKDGVSPFRHQSGDVDVKEAIELCQKAYWNVSIFKLTIDIMSEFANSNIHFKGKNKSTVKFFENWDKKINGSNLRDQFFRELFRSSNIFLYRLKGQISRVGKGAFVDIPLKYIVLNPADMRAVSSASFSEGANYSKVLNPYEVTVLRESTDIKNIELKKSLPLKTQKEIEDGISEVSIPIPTDDLVSIFFKKQDYEALAVPLYFPVLFDINLKLEFKKAEQIIARACEYMILLINVGDKDDGTDQAVVESIEQLFSTESVGRVMITDWSTKMSFVMPELDKILGPEKYVAVNQDIANGLMNIFFGDSKYADSMVKIKVFLERLKEARKIYLSQFLIPEMDAICEKMGFRECPEPFFEEINLNDELEYKKIYNRLSELGILTPEEVLKAYDTGVLPEPYDSVISQEAFKKQKDDGLYIPVSLAQVEDPNATIPGQSGRPTGTPQKQKQKKVTPVGASATFSAEKLAEVSKTANLLIAAATVEVKSKFKVERISKKNKDFAKNIAFTIMQNEEIDNWFVKLRDYLDNPTQLGPIYNEVADLAGYHQIDFNSAALLYQARITSQSE